MKTTLLHILALLMPLTALASTTPPELDSMLRAIDKAIAHTDDYVAVKEQRIATLTDNLRKAKSTRQRLVAADQLAEAYVPFVNDSCIHYLNVCAQLADQLGMTSRAGGYRSHAALMYSNAGMFVDALSMLDDVDEKQLTGEDLGMYYMAHAHIYGECSYYARFDDLRAKYGTKAYDYRQLMYRYLPATSQFVWQNYESDLLYNGPKGQSKALNDRWLKSVRKGSHEYALTTFYRYLEYKALGDTLQMMRWLGESVLTDVRSAAMDQGSMWEMANELMVMGDVDRSYTYICYANECANRFGSRQRLARISPLMSEIAQKYKAEREVYYQRLRFALISLSVMAVLLLLVVLYVGKQRNRLAIARDRLADSNRQLQATNALLSEANRVKDEYVGRFMRLCSVYIDKLDDLRKMVNKKVKAHQYDELYELTRSQKFKAQELEDLYANFDKAFLRLFPNFVEEFNALLRPEERVTVEGEHLNTVVRIFALIRLGINDSSKIAEFLHYSVNTIYNYRAQVKKGALIDRNDFEDRVREIGLR